MLQDYLESFQRGVVSEFSFILSHGRVCAASASFSLKSNDDMALITVVAQCSKDDTETIIHLQGNVRSGSTVSKIPLCRSNLVA